MASIPPGSTIGILGGGQLGRMTALAARSMGYRLHVLDPDALCSASPVADRVVAAPFDDVDAARDFARHCDVITLEIEQIATSVLDAAAQFAPTRPASGVIGIIQDRAKQKEWLATNGFPLGAFRVATSATELHGAMEEMGDAYVKSCRGGYDGRSQLRVGAGDASAPAWRALGEMPVVVERALSLAAELSVMVARRPGGESVAYQPALNHHERQILSWSLIPAPIAPALAARATELALGIAAQLQLEGILGIELFLTSDGALLVNELAPRPHNSYHASERACVTGQFEQITRAVCDLPLGDVSIVRPGAIVNLFGDLWADGSQPDFSAALGDPRVRLHLYGKRGPRPGRKMGHLSAIGGSSADALRAVRDAASKLGLVTADMPSGLHDIGVRA
ncbi:MAG TPA: 5-(carboxyamino)imidazole ribonucleotide synthase [Gemmatimonadaceae bacterium]|nr:5-(carboxyamino)imidazole ribonucleotide synthase [Gemmatimonadaceae bacterium]